MRPLTAEDGPMVWIDCEMTGLDPRTNRIMEIAVGNMREVYETVDLMYIFYRSSSPMGTCNLSMKAWNVSSR
jgi:oligoribonuclease (3'-5' exoribonuclease)